MEYFYRGYLYKQNSKSAVKDFKDRKHAFNWYDKQAGKPANLNLVQVTGSQDIEHYLAGDFEESVKQGLLNESLVLKKLNNNL